MKNKFFLVITFGILTTCILLANDIADHPNQDEVEKQRTVEECLLSNSVSPEEMGKIATLFDVPGYHVVQQSGFQLVRDEQRAAIVLGRSIISTKSVKCFGQQLYFGDTVLHGLIWNSGSDEIVFVFSDTGDEYIVGANELICIGNYFDQDGDGSGASRSQEPTGCTISCKSGYYACCGFGPPPTFVCYKEGTNFHCPVGGEGTAACGVSIQP